MGFPELGGFLYSGVFWDLYWAPPFTVWKLPYIDCPNGEDGFRNRM